MVSRTVLLAVALAAGLAGGIAEAHDHDGRGRHHGNERPPMMRPMPVATWQPGPGYGYYRATPPPDRGYGRYGRPGWYAGPSAWEPGRPRWYGNGPAWNGRSEGWSRIDGRGGSWKHGARGGDRGPGGDRHAGRPDDRWDARRGDRDCDD